MPIHFKLKFYPVPQRILHNAADFYWNNFTVPQSGMKAKSKFDFCNSTAKA